jgi:hypothetical protein
MDVQLYKFEWHKGAPPQEARRAFLVDAPAVGIAIARWCKHPKVGWHLCGVNIDDDGIFRWIFFDDLAGVIRWAALPLSSAEEAAELERPSASIAPIVCDHDWFIDASGPGLNERQCAKCRRRQKQTFYPAEATYRWEDCI